MKITILSNFVKDSAKLDEGVSIAKKWCESIGLQLELYIYPKTLGLNSVPFDNSAATNNGASKGYMVNPQQIIPFVDKTADITCLAFDWSRVIPRPTNPMQNPLKIGNSTIIQIPEQWCGTPLQPEVFAQFFLHEICHAMYFLLGQVQNDKTHFEYEDPAYSQKQPQDWYLHLIQGMLPAWNQYKKSVTPASFRTIKFGNSGLDVQELQKLLNDAGFDCGKADSYFGEKTLNALKKFQRARNLTVDGVYGPKSRSELTKKKSKLDLWAQAVQKFEGWSPSTLSFKNNNPGNLKFIGQSSALGADSRGFAVFRDYEAGLEALKAQLRHCATKSTYYKPDGDLNAWAAVYAPASDNNQPTIYAKFVADYIGVPISTKIKDLL